MQRPLADEYPKAFAGYVSLVPEADILAVLRTQTELVREVARRTSPQRETYSYAPGKWTLRQVVGHVGDAERVFGYRTLCISRGDPAPLPGFDENAYVDAASFNDIHLAALVDEFASLRSANLRLIETLRVDQWPAAGIANGNAITVRGLAYVMAGHVHHHLKVLRDRYMAGAEG